MAVDKPAGADTAHAPAQPGKWRLGGALWLLGMPGVVTVVWALLPTLKVNEALLPLPLEAVLLLSGLQTAVLLALAWGWECGWRPASGCGRPLCFPGWQASLQGLRCGPNSCPDSVAVSWVPHGCGSCLDWRLRRSSPPTPPMPCRCWSSCCMAVSPKSC